MEELCRVLEKTVSNVQSDQSEAARFIQDYTQRDPIGFLQTLSDVLFDQQQQPVVRTAAGLQLKNILTARDATLRQQQQDRWRLLPNETRQYIKDRVFRTLGTEIFRPSSAPQCVAYIAIVELPSGQWPGLIEALTHNVTDPNSTPQLKLASLEAIGCICQDIDQSCLQKSESDRILGAIMSQDTCVANDIRQAATSALLNFFENKIHKIAKDQRISKNQKISLYELAEHLEVEPHYAEKIVAQMIREERIQGHVNQLDEMVYFESKNVFEVFDDEILQLCSEVNCVIEKLRTVVPDEWWAANAHQAS